jgi:uncharacterized membrane protein
VKIVQLLAMSLFTLVTGVFWGTWFSLSRSVATLAPATFLEVGHTMIANLAGPMSVLMPATIVSVLVLVVVLYHRHDAHALVLSVVALALLVVSTVITLAVNVPIDGQIARWTVETLPGDWERIRNRWEFYHGLRTALTLVGAACLFAGALWTHRHRNRDGQVTLRAGHRL